MASLSTDAAAAKRTFANVAASASLPAQPIHTSNNIETTSAGQTGLLPQLSNSSAGEVIITSTSPKKLANILTDDMPPTLSSALTGPDLVIQSPVISHTANAVCSSLNGPLASANFDENTTQLSSSASSQKPASLDGKSVASVTTFAMDEKESLRPDDSASVKAIEDEDLYSPPGSAAIGSRMGSDTGAPAFRDQLQEIQSSRMPRPVSRPDLGINPAGGVLYTPSPLNGPTHVPDFVLPVPSIMGKPDDLPPDPKLLEALNNPRDRIWVLKLEQDIIDFVKDSKEHALDLPQCNSFYRMLAHKLADYYILGHAVDNAASAVRLYKTPTCRIAPPLTGVTNPSTAASTPPPTAPQLKILRRGGDGSANGLSKSASEAGDNGSDSDKNKAPMTREQREQRYEEARLRILGSAKPTEEVASAKEKDESRSSSAAGKKKPRKQRTNSEDGFESRSSFNMNSSYSSNGASESSTSAAYYPNFPEKSNAMYGSSNGYPSNASYSAVYGGQTMPQQMGSYPWLQQGYAGYSDQNNQTWDQPQQNGNDLANDFQRAMSFQQHNMHGPTSPPSQNNPYGYPNQQQYQQHQPAASWQQTPQYPSNYSMPSGYPSQYGGQQTRPSSSTSQVPAAHGYPYGISQNQGQMQDQYTSYANQMMYGGFNQQAFNPQSQAFIPSQQATSGPQHFMSGMAPPNAGGYGSFQQPGSLQRQGSTHSISSYGGPRPAQDVNNLRGPGAGMTHPLPQPVFSQQLNMSHQNPQRQQQMPQNSGSSGAPSEKSTQSNGASASTIAKWGTPASLPAKPPPPASDSFDMSRLAQSQRTPTFSTVTTARLPGVGGPGFHALPPMVGIRGSATVPSPRSGQ